MKWTEAKITELQKEGRGCGTGATYLPWLDAFSISSKGRTRRVWSPKSGRTHHLFSDVEYRLFLALEWMHDVIDIREQFPLDRDLTQDVARTIGIRHPHYPGTHVPTVMTVDFFITRVSNGAKMFEAYNAKRTEEAEDETSLLKLEIQRSTLELLKIPHHLVFHSDIPKTKVDNIDWIRDSLVKDGEVQPRPGYWVSITQRMSQELAHVGAINMTLAQYCSAFDARHGAEPGTGLRAARMLMFERVLQVNLEHPELEAAPLSSFQLTASSGKLRAVGSF